MITSRITNRNRMIIRMIKIKIVNQLMNHRSRYHLVRNQRQ